MGDSFSDWLVDRTRLLSQQVSSIEFSIDAYVYNPLEYAWDAHEIYLRRFVHKGVHAVFLGMNPGPFGMAQTGVPFGEIHAVREWMRIETPVGKPKFEHPARPVLGFATTRSEISGKRVWALMARKFETAESCFGSLAILNYCPLVFVDNGPTGKNIVPEKLPRGELGQLESVCDDYLDAVVSAIGPAFLVGVGTYATQKLQEMASRIGLNATVCTILHPSPGNPRANTDWEGQASRALVDAGVWQ